MLMNETILNLGYLGSMYTTNCYEDAQRNPLTYIKLFAKEQPQDNNIHAFASEHFMVEDPDTYRRYYFCKTSSGFDLYESLPLVVNDSIFQWSEKKLARGGRVLMCNVKVGVLKFNITFYPNTNDASIHITFNGKHAYDSYHINYMRVQNATNSALINELNAYIRIYKQETDKMELLDYPVSS